MVGTYVGTPGARVEPSQHPTEMHAPRRRCAQEVTAAPLATASHSVTCAVPRVTFAALSSRIISSALPHRGWPLSILIAVAFFSPQTLVFGFLFVSLPSCFVLSPCCQFLLAHPECRVTDTA